MLSLLGHLCPMFPLVTLTALQIWALNCDLKLEASEKLALMREFSK